MIFWDPEILGMYVFIQKDSGVYLFLLSVLDGTKPLSLAHSTLFKSVEDNASPGIKIPGMLVFCPFFLWLSPVNLSTQ